MSNAQSNVQLSEDDLAEHWFSFLHQTFAKLKDAVISRGITQEIIAKRLGSDKGLVSRWLSGHCNLTLRTMFKIARVMNYRMEINFVDLDKATPINRHYIPHQLNLQDSGVRTATTRTMQFSFQQASP